jgi:predicted GIY-YIG superfamily endonuclease
MFYVYILECGDGSYYTGHTDDIIRRVASHAAGTVPGFTSQRLPIKVRYVQEFPSRAEALRAEKQIQGWTRKKKEALMTRDWNVVARVCRGLD